MSSRLVCLFDIDGTLLRTGGAGMAALEEALQSEFNIPRVADVPVSGRTDRAIIGDLFRLHRVPATEEHWERICSAYLTRLPLFLAGREGRILPGVAQLLDELAATGEAAVGLLTGNMRRGADVKLNHFGLHSRFTFGAFGDEHCDRDDIARAAWQEVIGRFEDATPERTWVIGDTPHDVKCARAIGARAVAVATGNFSREQLAECRPDLLLEDMSDVAGVLEAWR